MDLVVTVIVVVVIIALVYQFFLRPRGERATATTAGRPAAAPREASLTDLSPGDVLILFDSGDRIVSSVLRCSETVGGRTSRWQWALLDDGRVIEAAPDGVRLFSPLGVVYQGSAEFERLVPPDGALGVFEARVRAGEVGRNPVHFDYDGRVYKIASTGTFAANVEGEELAQEVWRDISADPSQNVYFEMEEAGAPVPGGNGNGARQAQPRGGRSRHEGGEEILGIWTSHIWLGRGRKLSDADVAGLYGKR